MHEHFDVIIVGAGLSGICAAYRLQTECPDRSYVILEARDRIGGTWDLFRYPGVRSDSDMATLGFPFEPWSGEQVIAEGETIREYIVATARKYGIDGRIRFGRRVDKAGWEGGLWRIGELTCNFLFMCSGYYAYESGYSPELPGLNNFQGKLIHPQHWPEDYDYLGKEIVVVGSGATAVTLLPALARKARRTTMLQRSPSYVLPMPSRQMPLPPRLQRWKNVLLGILLYWFSRRFPKRMKRFIKRQVARYLGRQQADEHFTPGYNPWDQRMCFAPDGDFFQALRSGRARVVTGEIQEVTPEGVTLKSGQELLADVLVLATGLKLQLFGGASLEIDGQPLELSEHTVYKGMMFDDVPNAAMALGYTNMSWTLRCDLIAQAVCRILNHMRKHGYRVCIPRKPAGVGRKDLLDFSSGYIRRAQPALPKQGVSGPWRLHQNYLKDLIAMRWGPLADDLEFL